MNDEKTPTSLGLALFSDKLLNECLTINQGFKELQIFHKKTEEAWDSISNELDKRMEDLEAQCYEEEYGLDMYYNEKYVGIHRDSIVITVYNFLENSLNNLCTTFSGYLDSKVKLKDISGAGVMRAITYLKKVANIDFSSMGEQTSYVYSFNKLRNNVVHAGGVLLNDEKNDLYKFIQTNINLSGKPGGRISITSKFIDQTIEVLITFFKKLKDEIHFYLNQNTYADLNN